MRSAIVLFMIPLTVGCSDDLVELQGVVVHGPQSTAEPAAGAVVSTIDNELLAVGTTTTADDGWFRVDARPGLRTFMQVDGPGLAPASFSGKAGLNPRQRIPTGEVFAVSEELKQTWLEIWAGCPGADSGAGWMIGEVHALGWQHEDGTPFIVEQATVTVSAEDGASRTACYLNDQGVYDPNATQTGLTGRYFVPNLPEGRHRAEVTWEFADTPGHTSWFDLYVPEGGIAPRWPLYMELAQ